MAHKKILVVDDDEFIRDLYEEILTDGGFTIETALNGKDGVEKIEKGGYDLILLDIMMPKMDGIEVLKEINKMKGVKNGPVVLLTNLAHDPVLKEAKSLGALDYLIKADLTPDQLVDKVKAIYNSYFLISN